MKIVVTFDYDKGLNKLTNEYLKSYDEQIDNKINERLSGFFTNFSFVKEVDYTTGQYDTGVTWFQFYPSIGISGETGLSESDWFIKHDNLIAEIRMILLDLLQSPPIGAENIEWHIHYSWGSVNIAEP